MKATYGILLTVGIITLASTLFTTGCQKQASAPSSASHTIVGKVTEIATDKSTVKLDHEDIPGVMEAMEMNFAVANGPKTLEGISVGDKVRGELERVDGSLVIKSLKKQ